MYQLFLERTGRASMIITRNRDTAEWICIFDHVLLAQSAVGRLKNAAFAIVVDGGSYRPRLQPQARRQRATQWLPCPSQRSIQALTGFALLSPCAFAALLTVAARAARAR
ncbi:ATP-binding protein [Pendulispora brunnea]|uniref:ATP-binding protein n=1 Tax=Pendulispora brunnea TaxID=2905690 RepID=UPI00374E1857